MPAFALAKQCLLAPNLLPSSWDVALHPLLDLINSSTAHVTTSSCSGRILVYSAADADPEPGEAPFAEALAEDSESSVNIPDEADDESVDGGTPDSGKGQGKARSTTVNGRTGGATLWSSHNVVDVPREEWQVLRLLFKGVEIIPFEDNAPLSDLETVEDTRLVKRGILSFKFEAAVLNITSKNLEASVPLLQAALRTGHRSSGLVLQCPSATSPPGASYLDSLTTLAIRTSTMSMSCPIARRVFVAPSRYEMASWLKEPTATRSKRPRPALCYQLLVPPSYLSFLLRQANVRMVENFKRTERLYQAFDELLKGGQTKGREDRRTDRVETERVRVATNERFELERAKDERVDQRLRDGVGGVDDWRRSVLKFDDELAAEQA